MPLPTGASTRGERTADLHQQERHDSCYNRSPNLWLSATSGCK